MTDAPQCSIDAASLPEYRALPRRRPHCHCRGSRAQQALDGAIIAAAPLGQRFQVKSGETTPCFRDANSGVGSICVGAA